MTSLFIERGTRLRFPSGTEARFVRWGAKAIDPAAPSIQRKMERIAVVEVAGEMIEFSERFMQLAKIMPEAL